MRLRIRNSFKHRSNISPEEKSNILAYNIWQISLAGAKNLHQEDYHYEDDMQRVGVIREYLIFLIHIADRMVYDDFDEKQRGEFVNDLAKNTANHIQRNTEEIMGAGDYRADYFGMINDRFNEYSNCSFEDGMPGYSLLRTFGEKVCDIMGFDDQTNKWTIDQIMDIDGPMMVEKMTASLNSIIDQPSEEEKKKSSVELLLDEG
ncbi:MAG: hypothetical protein V3V09_03390 [Arenicellales bacterium]